MPPALFLDLFFTRLQECNLCRPPALRVKLIILEVLNYGVTSIHKLFIKILTIQIADCHPSAIDVFAGLIIEV